MQHQHEVDICLLGWNVSTTGLIGMRFDTEIHVLCELFIKRISNFVRHAGFSCLTAWFYFTMSITVSQSHYRGCGLTLSFPKVSCQPNSAESNATCWICGNVQSITSCEPEDTCISQEKPTWHQIITTKPYAPFTECIGTWICVCVFTCVYVCEFMCVYVCVCVAAISTIRLVDICLARVCNPK